MPPDLAHDKEALLLTINGNGKGDGGIVVAM